MTQCVSLVWMDRYYPNWTKGDGRWVQQRVFTTVEGFLSQVDSLAKPAVADEGLIWAPPRGGFKGLFSIFDIFDRSGEAARALYELQYIPLVCSACTWEGRHPTLEVSLSNPRPMFWRVRCPECGNIAGPDIDDLDLDTILQRWKAMDRPRLEQPGAARSIRSIAPIRDLEAWLSSFGPMVNELSYVGQQLWPNLALFLQEAKQSNRRRGKRRERQASLPRKG